MSCGTTITEVDRNCSNCSRHVSRRMHCFGCGQPYCEQCSGFTRWYNYGRRRICDSCLIDHQDELGEIKVLRREYKRAGYPDAPKAKVAALKAKRRARLLEAAQRRAERDHKHEVFEGHEPRRVPNRFEVVFTGPTKMGRKQFSSRQAADKFAADLVYDGRASSASVFEQRATRIAEYWI